MFPLKTKTRTPDDDTDFNPTPDNHLSAKENAEALEKSFREEEREGRMFVTTEGALKQDFPGRPILIAAMGAVPKPDGGVRPVHDGTHYVHLNQGIKMVNQLQCPGAEEAGTMVQLAHESGEAVFSMSVDVNKAHRRVLYRKEDYPLLCCKADSSKKEIWVNTVGTFGVTSTPFWWSRLFGLLMRLLTRAMLREPFFHMAYVDDVHGCFIGPRKFTCLLMWLLGMEMLGLPLSYNKFQGGLQAGFVGYLLDYREVRVGIRSKSDGLSFVSRVLVWLKPHLSPLFAWKSAVPSGSALVVPDMVWLVMLFIQDRLREVDYMMSAKGRGPAMRELFRTDAKCEKGLVVLGGWELDETLNPLNCRWFSMRITPEQAPFLFKEDRESQWASGPAELLASLMAMELFGCFDRVATLESLEIPVIAGTDNRVNAAVGKKNSSTRWPLMLINMQLSAKQTNSRSKLLLRWRPRGENQEADDLTNEDFRKFDLQKRICAEYEDVDLSLLHRLWNARLSFLEARAQKVRLALETRGTS